MPRPRLRMGVGATVDVLVSKLHPKDVISKAYPNFTKNDKATGLIVLSKGPRQIRRQQKNVIIFDMTSVEIRKLLLNVGLWSVSSTFVSKDPRRTSFLLLVERLLLLVDKKVGMMSNKPMVQRIRHHFLETSICWFVMIIQQSQMRSIIS